MKLSSWSCSRQAVTMRTKRRPVMQLKYSLANNMIERRQLDPAVHAATATARREREEAKAKLFAELRKYWSSWTLDQALTLESEERYPCDLLRVFVEYAEGLWDARAASSLHSATSFEAYVESIEHSIVQGVLNQLLPDESLIIPEPEAMDVRCIETQENVAKGHLWGRIIRFHSCPRQAEI